MFRSVSIVGVITAVVAATSDASAQARHALLVGVSRYPLLAERYQLNGPPNDVELMRNLLIERFGFSRDGIRVLSEEAGEHDAAVLPTREIISREFARLAEVAGNGDDVVVFMAGHGAQQPQTEDDVHPEPDGLDQIFLPRDVGTWEDDGAGGKVANAITDDEIADWLSTIRDKGASLWIVFDCCHSGDITRGIGEKERFVPEGKEGLGIPEDAIGKARNRTEQMMETANRGTLEFDHQDGMAILYACQRNEKAIERNLPTPTEGDHYGLLTYCLNAVLSKAEGTLSYQELGRRVHLEYIRLGRTFGPTPLVEGGDAARAVLGIDTITRPLITVTRDDRTGKLKVDVGSLHGMTRNTILAIFPPPGEKAISEAVTPIGYARVGDVDVASALVSPCEHLGVAAPRPEVLIGSRCEIEELDYGDLKIAVAVDANDSYGKPIPAQTKNGLKAIVSQIADAKDSLVTRTAAYKEAEWLVRWHDGFVFLVPAAFSSVAFDIDVPSESQADKTLRLFKFGSFKTPEREKEEIQKALTRVARATNLLHFAAASSSPPVGIGAFSVEVRLEVHRLKDRLDRHGELLHPPVSTEPGDQLQFIVSNDGNVHFDLTLLYVDSRYGISTLFPDKVGINNRLHPGDTMRLQSIKINDTTLGREYLVVVAVYSEERQPTNFAGLEQSSIEKFRSGGAGKGGIQRLLEKGLFGKGTTRAARLTEVTTFRMDAIPFDVSAPNCNH